MTTPSVPPSPAHPEWMARLRAEAERRLPTGNPVSLTPWQALLLLDALSPAPPAKPWHNHVADWERHHDCIACYPSASPAPPSPEPGEAERLRRTQAEVAAWQHAMWPEDEGNPAHAIVKAAKVAEEVGEVCGAVIKLGARSTLQDVSDEVGDVLIAPCGLAAIVGIDVQDALDQRWAVVQARRYKGEHLDARPRPEEADPA